MNKIIWLGWYSMRNNRFEISIGRIIIKLCCIGCGKEVYLKGVFCFVRGKNCFRCGKSNYFVRVCFSSKIELFW